MRKRNQPKDETSTEKLVPLSELVKSGHGETAGELVDRFASEGVAVSVDEYGRLCVAEAVRDRLETEKDERERQAEAERERQAEVEAQRRAELAERQKREQREREQRARRQERIRRLEQATGMPVAQLEMQFRRAATSGPNSGMSLDERERSEETPVTLDQLGRWVQQEYGVEILEEAS